VLFVERYEELSIEMKLESAIVVRKKNSRHLWSFAFVFERALQFGRLCLASEASRILQVGEIFSFFYKTKKKANALGL
jgi:hypothetical protein